MVRNIRYLLCFTFLSALPLLSQLASTTSILGNIADSAGATVGGADVTATNTGTREVYTARTNEEGNYEFQFIKNGTYDVAVKKPGFESVVKTGIPVAVNQVVRVDFGLKVGQVSEQVVVTADVPPISTDDATLTEIISTKATSELPLNGRNPLKLALTVPTVIPGRKSPSGNPGGGEGYIGAGTREIQNSVSLDGVSIMNNLITTTTIRPNVDAIQEFQVQTGTYPAQYGGYMGVQLNLITKSGTNQLHGSLFEFVRNNKFDARNFFERPNSPRAPLRQNQFGGEIGGPVVLPGYNGRNRTFFMASYEGLRNRQAIPTIDNVFQPSWKSGNLSDFPAAIRNPFEPGTTFAGNIIPANLISPQALRILKYMPDPTGPGLGNNYNVNVPNSNNTNQTIDRVDQSIGENTRLFVRYAWANTDLVNGNSNPYNGYNQPVRDRNIVGAYTQVFSPTIINDLRVGRQHTTIDSVNFFNTPELAGAGTALGIPGFTTDIKNAGLPNIGITGFIAIGGQNMASSNWYQTDTTWQVADNLSITRGKHAISAGYDMRRLITARTANNNPRGGFTFSGTITGNAVADFLLGLPLSVTTPGPLFPAEVGQYRHGAFISDRWTVSPKLTLTLGLRYEVPTVPTSLNGNATKLNDEQTKFIPETVPQTIPLSKPDHNNLAPRIGIAYRVTDRFVLRAGFGMYYNPNQLNSYTLLTTNPPFATIFTFNSSPTAPTLTLANPTPTTAQAGVPKPNAVTLQSDLPTAYMNQWSFSVEHALWRNAGVDLQYLGSHSLHLDRSYFNNTPLTGNGTVPTLSLDARRPNQNFRQIRTIQNDMIANYEALSLVFRQQYMKGLTSLLSYTWSKTLDVTTDSNGGGSPLDPYNWRGDYGKSNWDVPHRFVASWTYELPWLRTSSMPIAKYVIGGWQANGIFIAQSGYPFNVVVPGDPANTSVGNQRPNLIGTPTADCGRGKLTNCINSSAFALPVTNGPYGNAGRNILRGPGFANVDFSLFKNIPIGEKVKFQFRAEAFNLLNTPQFANPNSTFNTATFGSITSTANPNRQIQFGAKILF